MRFPTREGISVPLHEIELPESRLDLSVEAAFNNHHDQWRRRDFGRHAVLQCLRDLESHQWLMPRDVHQWLHDRYDPPAMPTLKQAADEVMRAYEDMEGVRVYSLDQKRYVGYDIPRGVVNEIRDNYSQY